MNINWMFTICDFVYGVVKANRLKLIGRERL